jgi:hypothetical protein
MDIITVIKRDHDEVADLFDRLVMLSSADEAMRIARRLVARARIHSRAEERVVYETLRSHPKLKMFALAGPHEHENLDTTLDKLLVRHPHDEYRMIVGVARDLFTMHARDEEEAEMLPAMRQCMSADELLALGSEMLAEQDRIRPAA